MSAEPVGVFVQREVCVTPPLSVELLRGLLQEVPDDAWVEILDGELITATWQRHEPDPGRSSGNNVLTNVEDLDRGNNLMAQHI